MIEDKESLAKKRGMCMRERKKDILKRKHNEKDIKKEKDRVRLTEIKREIERGKKREKEKKRDRKIDR